MSKSAIQPFICVEHLTKSVLVKQHRLVILKDVSFEVEKGQSVAVVGVSGSGKTTLMGIMAGLDLPTRGRVLWEGLNICRLNEDLRASLRARDIGFIFQNFQLLPNLTALENVLLPLELKGIEDEDWAVDLLDQVGLADRRDHYPKQLSGGEQQRVAIARAFATKPRVLFADEPTGNLDQKTAQMMVELLFDLNKHYGTTLICATHDPSLADRCEQIIQLSGGQRVS